MVKRGRRPEESPKVAPLDVDGVRTAFGRATPDGYFAIHCYPLAPLGREARPERLEVST